MSQSAPTHAELYERLGQVVGKLESLTDLIRQGNERHDRADAAIAALAVRTGKVEATMVPRDEYHQDQAEITKELSADRYRIASLEVSRARMRGMLIAVAALATTVGAMLSKWLGGVISSLFGSGPPPAP